ncbi:MAG: hypothetical protein LBN22_06775 [Clostridiales Family XIII bacterium]|nr:hypothetical protein [Clostridiales Family XIII bacterium]
MLGRLIKHELKSTSRLFLILYPALLVIALFMTFVNPFFENLSDSYAAGTAIYSFVTGMMGFLYGLLIVAIVVITMITIIMRFYKNVLGDEGYLMMTLPVTEDAHIVAKLIAALIWSIASSIVILISILFLISSSFDLSIFRQMREALVEASQAGVNVPFELFLVFAFILFGFISNVLIFYTAMAIGPNLTKNRLLGSFLAYIIIYIVTQILSTIGVVIWYLAGSVEGVMVAINNSYDAYSSVTSGLTMMNGVLITSLVTMLICCAAAYLITRYFLKHKLNLS